MSEKVKVDSGNYITTKRQMAIYNNVKNNSYPTNKNFKFRDASGCLVSAKNFELLSDFNTGKKQCDTI